MAKQKSQEVQVITSADVGEIPANLPVPVQQEHPLSLAPVGDEPRLTWFSWPVQLGEGEMINAQCRLGCDKRLLDMIGETIIVNRVMSYKEDIPDEETGELRRLQAIVLLSPDGKSYKCHSVGIAGAVRELLTALPSAPWEPPLILKVEERQTRKGKRMLWLKLVGRGSLPEFTQDANKTA